MTAKPFKIANINIGLNEDFFLIAGPCVIENKTVCTKIAKQLKQICENLSIPLIFKASFDKANRSSISSFRGPGITKGLEILHSIRSQTNLPTITDIHLPEQAPAIAKAVDAIQIPAFLCRQTDLLVAAAKTNKPVNIKKGQFLSPAEMKNVVAKVRQAGNNKITLTERGTFFGYNRLVNDMTAIPQMQSLDCPVIFDATHSTQQPGGLGNASAGNREMAPILAKAATAAGANGLFLEVHTDPAAAKSDAACIMPIEWVEPLLEDCKKIFNLIREK